MPSKSKPKRKARKPSALELELRLSIRLAKLAKRIAALERDLAQLKSPSLTRSDNGSDAAEAGFTAHNRLERIVGSTPPGFHGMSNRL